MKIPNIGFVDPSIVDEIFVDLDGVCADFEHEQKKTGHEPDIFKRMPGSYIWLPPIADAIESINFLETIMPGRVWFLTKPPTHSPYAYTEKALWTQRHFGDEGMHRLVVAQNKSLLGTSKSVLVDDRPHKGNVDKFRGSLIHFACEKIPGWEATLEAFATIVQR